MLASIQSTVETDSSLAVPLTRECGAALVSLLAPGQALAALALATVTSLLLIEREPCASLLATHGCVPAALALARLSPPLQVAALRVLQLLVVGSPSRTHLLAREHAALPLACIAAPTSTIGPGPASESESPAVIAAALLDAIGTALRAEPSPRWRQLQQRFALSDRARTLWTS